MEGHLIIRSSFPSFSEVDSRTRTISLNNDYSNLRMIFYVIIFVTNYFLCTSYFDRLSDEINFIFPILFSFKHIEPTIASNVVRFKSEQNGNVAMCCPAAIAL